MFDVLKNLPGFDRGRLGGLMFMIILGVGFNSATL